MEKVNQKSEDQGLAFSKTNEKMGERTPIKDEEKDGSRMSNIKADSIGSKKKASETASQFNEVIVPGQM